MITAEEAARRLGLSVATVKRQCASGRLQAEKVGRSWLLDERALPPPLSRPRSSRAAATALARLDPVRALAHLRADDLPKDTWVPDILNFEDDLRDPSRLIGDALEKVSDYREAFSQPQAIPVPKTPLFFRNAASIPIVDRLVYQAVVESFTPELDAALSANVFSYRLGPESSKHYLESGVSGWLRWRRTVKASIDGGGDWVVVADIASFFDFVKHDILLPELSQLGVDGERLAVLREMLRTWSVSPSTGLPQGPNASRVLANFYLAPVDEELATFPGAHYSRFMDDIRIVCATQADAARALLLLDGECRRRGLALSSSKTEILPSSEARKGLEEPELDAVQYLSRLRGHSGREVRKSLSRLFRHSLQRSGAVNKRHARFSLFRLFTIREKRVLNDVLDNLSALGVLGDLVPMYLLPWMGTEKVDSKVAAFLSDPDRNLSPYFSSWLLAAVLDLGFPDHRYVDYARRVAFDRHQPPYHRSLALSVVGLGGDARDVARIEEIVKREFDPEVVRGALVALARGNRLTQPIISRASRLPGMNRTLEYLRGRHDLPSLIFSSRRVPIVSATPGTSRR
jgi:excisionase family DNA binding protein